MAQLLDVANLGEDAVTAFGDLSAARFGYATVSDPEASFASPPAVDAIRSELDRAPGGGETDLAALRDQAATWAAAERERYRALADDPTSADLLVRRAALGCAPLALVSGAWLQWLSSPGNGHEETVLATLALYASDVGVGHPRASRGSAYLELLRQLRVADYASPAPNLVHDSRVPDVAFYLPSVLLAMGRRPDDLLPELLGADLCLRAVGMLPPLAVAQAVRGVHPDWAALDPGAERPGEAPGGMPQALAAIGSLLAGSPDAGERLATGFRWAYRTLRGWSDSLRLELSAALDPAHEMGELLRLRAREGSVYHQGFQLAGRSLSSWLADDRTGPGPLLAALASSKLVRPGRSESSPLVTTLVNEHGPMFRVFAPEELAVIRRWIDALPAADERPGHPPVPQPAGRPGPSAAGPWLGGRDGSDEQPRSVREAYHRLQARPGSPALRDWAESYVRGRLARARRGVADDNSAQLPARWSREGLRPWLLDQHDRHAEGFEADMKTPLPSREALVDSTLQLAPLILIDGSWLQGFTDYELASSEMGRFLFETYWDELGNGQPRLNHPRIYRDLLAQMGVQLPPTAAREFAESPLLEDRSFELPVYWLCIGHFPSTFLPEVLGLNVAMELSGVGGSYRRARIALKHYGYSTRFVDIHNTIDNVATGHTAWAADAVDTYMASVGNTHGREAQAAAWERIRAGFVSLNPPDGRLARRAERRAQKEALACGGRR